MKYLKKEFLIIRWAICFLIVSISCAKENGPLLNEKEEKEVLKEELKEEKDSANNSAPESVKVSVLDITHNSATVNWYPAMM